MNNEYINKILCGNAIEELKKLEDNSINMCLTSPPYDRLRTYKGIISKKLYDGYYSFPFVDMAKELYRVMKEGSIICWVVADMVENGGESGNSFRQALKFQEIGFKIYDTMIYEKNGASYSQPGRYDSVFEYMFILLKGKKPNSVNLIRDKENRWAGCTNFGTPTKRVASGELVKYEKFTVAKYGTRKNIFYYKTGKGFGGDDDSFKHPASFPMELADDMILSWSNEGDVVLDPMCGGGTSLLAAKKNNRSYIGIDINEEYTELSKMRIEKVNPYTTENPNPKTKFISTREEILEKRKKK